MNHTHEQDEDSVEQIEDVLVMGRLMAVDWTKKTARLERFQRKPIKLLFGKELDEEMRRFATQFVQIESSGYLKAADTDKEEWVHINVDAVSLPYDGSKAKVFRKADWAADAKAIDETFDVDEFNRIVREGRHV